ncbi:MAG TPA: MFS transporter [Gammaproteobacteria bacterium]
MSAGDFSMNTASRSRWLTYENGILLLLGTSFGLVFFDRNTINFLAADIVAELELSGAQLGWLSSGLSLAWALSAYFVGAWSDRVGVRKPFVLGSIILFSLCSAFSGLATSFVALLLARVVMGIAEGPFLPVCLSIMNVESSPNRRGLNAGIMQNVFAALLGTMVSGFLIPRLAEFFEWRATFFLTGIPGLICALLVWLYLKEPARDTAASAGPAHTVGLGALAMLKAHNIRVCCVVSIFMVAWFLVALVFLPIFFQNYRGFTAEQAGGLVGVTGLATLFSGFLVPAWSDRVGRKPAIILFCFLGMVTSLAALYFNGPLWMLGVLLFIGWSGTGSFPLFMGVVPGETVSRSLAASSMGLVVCIGELVGGAAIPPAAGWLADRTSLAAPVIVVGVCAFCAGVAALFLKETAPRKVGAAPGQRAAEYRKAA